MGSNPESIEAITDLLEEGDLHLETRQPDDREDGSKKRFDRTLTTPLIQTNKQHLGVKDQTNKTHLNKVQLQSKGVARSPPDSKAVN